MPVSRRLALTVVGFLVALLAGAAHAQEGFRITYEADNARPDKARLTGTVTNERGQDVYDVNVTAEALDARGKVVARGIAFVDSRIGHGDSRQFSVSVPTKPGIASYRVVVSSYRAGGFNQGP